MDELIQRLGGEPPSHQVRQFASENFRLMEVKIPAASLKKVGACLFERDHHHTQPPS